MRLTLVLVALALAGCAAPEPHVVDAKPQARSTFIVALPAGVSEDALARDGPALERALEESLAQQGMPRDVVLQVAPSNTVAVDLLKRGELDAAMLSAWPAAIAASQAGAQIVLAELREVVIDEQPVVMSYYYSHYIVRKDSPYEDLTQLRGKDAAFPSPTSTSGYVFPLAQLVNQGLIPRALDAPADADLFFGEVVFAGSYQKAWEALRDGEVEVAVIAGDVNPALYEEVRANTRALAKQGPVPSHAVVLRHGLAEADHAALTEAFLELDAQKAAVRNLGSATFVAFQPTTTEEHARALNLALATTGLTLDGF